MSQVSSPREISTRAQSAPEHPDEVVVVVLTGPQRGRRTRIAGRLRIGKSPDNDLVLSDDTVSRHHCELERSSRGIRVHDLGSTNQTRVGRTAVHEAVVEPGATITVRSPLPAGATNPIAAPLRTSAIQLAPSTAGADHSSARVRRYRWIWSASGPTAGSRPA